MNKNKYKLTRLFQFLFGFIPSLFSLFVSRNKNTIIFNSQLNSTFEHNSRSLFIYCINHEKDINCKYVVNDEIKRQELAKLYGDHFITNYRLRDILTILRSNVWVCSSLETPLMGFFLNIRRNVFHLGHGSPVKSIGLGEGYLSFSKAVYYRIIRTNFSYFMSSSPAFDKAWRNCLDINDFQVIRCPQARCDELSIPSPELIERHLSCSRYNILYAPTWRPLTETKLFPFDDFDFAKLNSFLENRGIKIHLRLHPNFESKVSQSLVHLDSISLISSNCVKDINQLLGAFDLLITDYSSIYVDFLLTEKPLIFLPYDLEEYSRVVGFSIDYEKLSPGPKPKTMTQFIEDLDALLQSPEYYLTERRTCNQILNSNFEDHCTKAIASIKNLSRF